MKTLLFNVELDDGLDKRVDATLALAEKYGSHVIASHIAPTPQIYLPYAEVYMVTADDLRGSLEEELESVRRKTRERFETLWPSAGPSWEWQEEKGIPDKILAEKAHTADLTIIGLKDSSAPESILSETLAADITMATGLPVLALPMNTSAPLGNHPVVIAWDGSLEAVHAIHAAMPFLEAAPSVIVAEIHEDKPRDMPSADIAPYLARRGLKVEVISRPAENTIANELLTVAQANGAELLVMGAFGHMRLKEYILGGTTWHMLQHATLPILFCH